MTETAFSKNNTMIVSRQCQWQRIAQLTPVLNKI